tara:strand:- start:208 stop:672 length:465 start_codon:yes stop_codon:yes gene_type:complete
MPFPSNIAWLIPSLPILSGILIGTLLASFNKTMNRLSKPVAFILISSLSISVVISFLLLSDELSKETINIFTFDSKSILPIIDFHFDLVFDILTSKILSATSSILLLVMVTYHFIRYKKERYVFFFVILSFINGTLLLISSTSFAEKAILKLLV